MFSSEIRLNLRQPLRPVPLIVSSETSVLFENIINSSNYYVEEKLVSDITSSFDALTKKVQRSLYSADGLIMIDIMTSFRNTLGPNDLKICHLGQVCALCKFSYQNLHSELDRYLDHFQIETKCQNVILKRHI